MILLDTARCCFSFDASTRPGCRPARLTHALCRRHEIRVRRFVFVSPKKRKGTELRTAGPTALCQRYVTSIFLFLSVECGQGGDAICLHTGASVPTSKLARTEQFRVIGPCKSSLVPGH